MKENTLKFDRELGELVQLHRVARSLSIEDMAADLGLPPNQVGDFEAGIQCLTVCRFWMIMSFLKQDPIVALKQFGERWSVAEPQQEEFERSAVDFLVSNRGRKVVGAMAMCKEPQVLDALADLILAICVQTQARDRASGCGGGANTANSAEPF